MNLDTPNIINLIETLSKNVMKGFNAKTYFTLSKQKKRDIQLFVYKYLANILANKFVLTKEEMESILVFIILKNNEVENYELSGVLKDIITNLDDLFTTVSSKYKLSMNENEE